MSHDASHALTSEAVAHDLATRRIGRRVVVLREIDSTNGWALETLARDEGVCADGVVVFAERQTAGRGRLGRSWHSSTGASLMFTVLLWEHLERVPPSFWVMAAAVSMVQGIEAASDVHPVIRWPNDIYVTNRKLAGILVEVQRLAPGGAGDRAALAIGVGLNCLQHEGHFPESIRQMATSMELASSHPVDRVNLARSILRSMDSWMSDPGGSPCETLAAEWSAHSADIGTRATLLSGGERYCGLILEVHPQDGLVLQLDSGARRHFDPATTSRLQGCMG